MNLKKLALAMALTATTVAGAAAEEHLHSLDATQIDNTIAPGTDFYGYVNKKWQQANPLTPEHARYGMFDLLRENAKTQLRQLPSRPTSSALRPLRTTRWKISSSGCTETMRARSSVPAFRKTSPTPTPMQCM